MKNAWWWKFFLGTPRRANTTVVVVLSITILIGGQIMRLCLNLLF